MGPTGDEMGRLDAGGTRAISFLSFPTPLRISVATVAVRSTPTLTAFASSSEHLKSIGMRPRAAPYTMFWRNTLK